MSKKQKINVEGLSVVIESGDYISLSDIAKRSENPKYVIYNWMRNTNTIRYLYEWERIHNRDVKGVQMHTLLEKGTDNRFTMTPAKWIETVNAVGLKVKAGRGGGTFAHKDIALNFCYWPDPVFQIYFIKEFQRLKEEEAKMPENNRTWHISKITDYVDNARILLDTIPGQLPENQRVNDEEE